MSDLLSRWRRDLAAAGATTGPADEVGSDLARRWAEPHRHYHTLQHLAEVLAALDELEVAGAVDEPGARLARLAAWFHDAVYAVVPGGDDEAASAALARESLARVGLPRADVETVAHLVEDTVAHDVPQRAGCRAALVDADLWVLSAPTDRFDEYCAQVRAEYAVVPDAAYAAGRSAVLSPFLSRSSVYATAHARGEWESRARSNLARELSRL